MHMVEGPEICFPSHLYVISTSDFASILNHRSAGDVRHQYLRRISLLADKGCCVKPGTLFTTRSLRKAKGRRTSLKCTPGISAVRFWSKHSAGCLSPLASGSLLWGHMQLRLLVPVFLQRSLLL